MNRPSVWVLLCLAVAAGLVWWHFRTITVASRLTLEMELDVEAHVGSGVIATYWARNANPLASAGGGMAHRDSGEAVPVDLGRYGLLFVTLQGKYLQGQLPMSVYGGGNTGDGYWDYLLELGRPKAPREIPHEALPLLIRFRDTNRPDTVECVDPEHMEASYPSAASVKLVHATLAIVNEPVTAGRLDKLLPWLTLSNRERGPLMNGPVWNWLAMKPGECRLQPWFLETIR